MYRTQIALNQSGTKGLAENPRHIDLDRVTDEFLLIGLRPDEDVIRGKPHDPFQFGDAEHPHLYIDDAIQRHEMLDFCHRRTVVRGYCDCAFLLLHSAGYELVLRVGRNRWCRAFDVAGRSVPVLHIHEREPIPCSQRRRGCVDGVVMPVPVICRDERVMIPCRYRPRRLLDRYAFACRTASVVLGEEIDLRDAEPILSYDSRAWFVDAWSVILPRAAHRVPFHQKRLFASGYELYQARIDSFQRRIDERFLAPENALALIREVQHLAHGFPALHLPE